MKRHDLRTDTPIYTRVPAYAELKKRVSLQAGGIVCFVGAGLSRPSGLPTWPELRQKIMDDYRAEAEIFDEAQKNPILKGCDAADKIDDLWIAFSQLKKLRGVAVFEASVRRHLNCSSIQPPPNYKLLWKLGLTGMVSLNLDDFAKRAFSSFAPGDPLVQFSGDRIAGHVDAIGRGVPFLCNLHGTLDDAASWVFTDSDRATLHARGGMQDFVSSCFLSGSVIFVGITAEDVAAGGLLKELLDRVGTSQVGRQYWISDRTDPDAASFADKYGVSRICYSADNNHQELTELLRDLASKTYEPKDPEEIVPPEKRVRNLDRPSPQDLAKESNVNKLRFKLNQIAANILKTSSPTRSKDYQNFIEDYEEQIHRAWYIPKSGKADYFHYRLERLIASNGAFGKVYEASDEDGGKLAVKIIHDSVHAEPEMLEAFRRGVASMRIVAKHQVPGVVGVNEAWEVPATIVMDFIDGYNLEDAVSDHLIVEWGARLNVLCQLAEVLLRAHRLPEVVVHRDVRPPNIILQGFYQESDNVEVRLVDFDLSWHRDAFGQSLQQEPGVHGYFAPEQYRKVSGSSARSALVDSYGFAMTAYYVITKTHPVFGEINAESWSHELTQRFRFVKCDSWASIPTRMARLVLRSSDLAQQKRMDMTAISLELKRLRRVLERDQVDDLRLIVDEIGHRAVCLSGSYQWDELSGSLHWISPSGLTVDVGCADRDRIQLRISWMSTGSDRYESLRKFLETDVPGVEAVLRSKGWTSERTMEPDGFVVNATRRIKLGKVDIDFVKQCSSDVDEAVKRLSYKRQ